MDTSLCPLLRFRPLTHESNQHTNFSQTDLFYLIRTTEFLITHLAWIVTWKKFNFTTLDPLQPLAHLPLSPSRAFDMSTFENHWLNFGPKIMGIMWWGWEAGLLPRILTKMTEPTPVKKISADGLCDNKPIYYAQSQYGWGLIRDFQYHHCHFVWMIDIYRFRVRVCCSPGTSTTYLGSLAWPKSM